MYWCPYCATSEATAQFAPMRHKMGHSVMCCKDKEACKARFLKSCALIGATITWGREVEEARQRQTV